MALQTSGQISLNDVNVELGNSGTAQIDMNSAAVRGLFGIASGQIAMSDGYGKANTFSLVISSSTQEANLNTLATAAGWDGSTSVDVTINSSVYLWSDDTANPGLLVNIPCTITNYGKIIGKGGLGGGANAGGAALSVTSSGVSITNASGAYIAGGGGGGGGTYRAFSQNIFMAGGGGGAGGGDGNGTYRRNDTYYWVIDVFTGDGGAIGQAGGDQSRILRRYRRSNNADMGTSTGADAGKGGGAGGGGGTGDLNNYSGGGGGGRILPGTGGAGSAGGGGAGGSAGAAGTNGETQTSNFNGAGGGGGGWGAAGGAGGTAGFVGGAGGAAIIYTSSYTLSNSGTIYGAT